MKSNLAVLSSDNKTIKFIEDNNINDLCYLYANSSRNIDNAQSFCNSNSFQKYYGSYEELINDDEIEFLINFLPTGIKFEYTYLALKKDKKIISNYPVISNKNELNAYKELIDLGLMSNLFLINDQDFEKFYSKCINKKYATYLLTLKQDQYNNLSSNDILFDLTPDLFFFINQYKELKPTINSLVYKKNKITNRISYLSCLINFEDNRTLSVVLDNGDPKNSHHCEYFYSNAIISKEIVNKNDLFMFIQKKSFDNRSDFQYYPFKLFQEVLLNE